MALSVDLRPPGVTWHSTLWSPDFPHFSKPKVRLPNQLRVNYSKIYRFGKLKTVAERHPRHPESGTAA